MQLVMDVVACFVSVVLHLHVGLQKRSQNGIENLVEADSSHHPSLLVFTQLKKASTNCQALARENSRPYLAFAAAGNRITLTQL